MSGSEAIGIDVGGTKIAVIRIARAGDILASETVPTPATDPEATLQSAIDVAAGLRSSDVGAVGIGAAGIVDFASGILRYAPNLAWRELALRDRIGKALGLPCILDNDANVAAWGEFRFGAGKGSTDMLLVTVGTGIGGGIIAGGKPFRGANGFAGEIGHIIVEPGGPLCGCGNLGCWEQVAAGRAIDRLAREAVGEHPHSLLGQLAGGDASHANGRLVTTAAEQGDDVAKSILATVGTRLGQGIAGLVNVLDCDSVVVGGGAIVAGDLLLDPARSAFAEAIEAPEHRPAVPLLAAQLGPRAGAVGAAAMAMDELMPE
jgi:glucokinase